MKDVQQTDVSVTRTKEVPERVAVDMIIADPDQPRKTFNKHKDEELYLAVVEHGVFQSLLLRPYEKKLMIVCGERRYNAALRANLPDVPAIIRVLTDTEARIIQHIENIQRDNVNVMEQARGFQVILRDDPTMTEDYIAAKIGKTVYYVRQNIKLNDLTPEWQHMVYMMALSVTLALQIAQLPESAQKALYKDAVPKGQENSSEPKLNLNSQLIKKYQGLLVEACFDLADPKLVEKVGACHGCPYNSASANLFPSESDNPRCSNIGCFRSKEEANLKNQLDVVKNDPSLLVAYESYRTTDYANALKAENIPVVRSGYGEDCHVIAAPTEPNEAAFLLKAKKEKISKKETKRLFDKAKADYTDKMAYIEKKLAQGTYKKALMIDDQNGVRSGKYVVIEMDQKQGRAPKKVDTKKSTVTVAEIQGEIDRIEGNYKRSLELDQVHIQEAIVAAYKEYEGRDVLPKKVLKVDTAMLNFLLLEMLSYTNKEVVVKQIKKPMLWQDKNLPEFHKALLSITPVQISFIVRQIIEDKHINSLPTSKAGYLVRQLAEQMNCFPIKDIESKQGEKTTKRTENKNQRVNALKTQKTALEQPQAKVVPGKTSKSKNKAQQLQARKKTA